MFMSLDGPCNVGKTATCKLLRKNIKIFKDMIAPVITVPVADYMTIQLPGDVGDYKGREAALIAMNREAQDREAGLNVTDWFELRSNLHMGQFAMVSLKYGDLIKTNDEWLIADRFVPIHVVRQVLMHPSRKKLSDNSLYGEALDRFWSVYREMNIAEPDIQIILLDNPEDLYARLTAAPRKEFDKHQDLEWLRWEYRCWVATAATLLTESNRRYRDQIFPPYAVVIQSDPDPMENVRRIREQLEMVAAGISIAEEATSEFIKLRGITYEY